MLELSRIGQEHPHLLRTAAGDGDLGGPLERLLACGHIDDGEPADDLLGLRERAVGHQAVGVDDARLLAIARTTGRVRWVTQLERWRNPKKETGPIFWTGPVLANNRLWIASSEGIVLSADVTTGETAEFTDLNNPVSLPPIVANRILYILDDSGRITAWR